MVDDHVVEDDSGLDDDGHGVRGPESAGEGDDFEAIMEGVEGLVEVVLEQVAKMGRVIL